MPDLNHLQTTVVTGAHEIVLYDGVCGFCDATVNRIIRNDRNDRYRFAALQSETGIALRRQYQLPPTLDSMVLVNQNGAFVKSGAVIRIFAGLGGPWQILKIFLLVPGWIRNSVYDFIAARRHLIMKQKQVCALPTPEIRKKYLV